MTDLPKFDPEPLPDNMSWPEHGGLTTDAAIAEWLTEKLGYTVDEDAVRELRRKHDLH